MTHASLHIEAVDPIAYHCPLSVGGHAVAVGDYPVCVYLSGTWDELADFADRLATLVAERRVKATEDAPTLEGVAS